MDLVSRLPEPLTVTNVALRLKLIQETAGDLPRSTNRWSCEFCAGKPRTLLSFPPAPLCCVLHTVCHQLRLSNTTAAPVSLWADARNKKTVQARRATLYHQSHARCAAVLIAPPAAAAAQPSPAAASPAGSVTSSAAVVGGPKPSAASTPSAADRQIADPQHSTPPGLAVSYAGGSPPVPAPQETASGGPELADRFGSLWAETDEAYYPLLSPPGAAQQGIGVVVRLKVGIDGRIVASSGMTLVFRVRVRILCQARMLEEVVGCPCALVTACGSLAYDTAQTFRIAVVMCE